MKKDTFNRIITTAQIFFALLSLWGILVMMFSSPEITQTELLLGIIDVIKGGFIFVGFGLMAIMLNSIKK